MLGGLGHFRVQRVAGALRIQLDVLHRPERGRVVAEHGQLRGQQVGDVERGQGLVVAAAEGRAAAGLAAVHVDPLHAHARGDPPLADRDAVVDVERVGVGGVVEAGGGAGRTGAAGDGVAAVVAALAQEAVAGGDVMHRTAPVQALGVARLDAEHAVVARLHGQLGASTSNSLLADSVLV
ncbi:hypothetical protein G6F59_014910 [Rhizopus arrhizus]|nr:hypothetical protein G6F59_014910 [Rhizopus arrhizus]